MTSGIESLPGQTGANPVAMPVSAVSVGSRAVTPADGLRHGDLPDWMCYVNPYGSCPPEALSNCRPRFAPEFDASRVDRRMVSPAGAAWSACLQRFSAKLCRSPASSQAED